MPGVGLQEEILNQDLWLKNYRLYRDVSLYCVISLCVCVCVCFKTWKRFAVINRRNDVERQNCVYSAIKENKNKRQLDKENTLNTNRKTRREMMCLKYVKDKNEMKSIRTTAEVRK